MAEPAPTRPAVQHLVVRYAKRGKMRFASHRDVARAFERGVRRAGLPITGQLHILRHTFCSWLAIRGATTKAIQKLAGHASLTTTQRYMHLSPAAKESAIRLLEFGVRGQKRREIGESGAASEENGR